MGHATEPRYLIVAGEASADAHAARVLRSLGAFGPCVARGITGPALEAAGAGRVVPMEDLAVIGFSGVIARLPRVIGAFRAMLAEAKRFRPDVAILVDAPDFNFRLGPRLKRMGIRVFYYVAPQVWAWRAGRARAMARWVDQLAVVFPFEEPIFRSAGVRVSFVGHPLLDTLEPEVPEAVLRHELGAGPQDRILGLLPGSRRGEVHHHLATLLAAAAKLAESRSDLIPVLALAPGIDADVVAAAAPLGLPARVRVVHERTRAVEAYARACAVASGTATLETALFGTPLVAVYRVGGLNYAIARRLVRLERIALPNIVAGDAVVEELIQADFTVPRLVAALAPLLDDPAVAAAARARLAMVRERLGEPGAADRVARLIREMTP